MEYRKGSEWRRWDLHVHTPHSVLCNSFGPNFDNYAKVLFEKAVEKDIAVIGVTDYFCISGYKELKLIQQERLTQILEKGIADKASKILLLPNIEFRIDVLADGNRVNFHVVFSDDVEIEDIEQNFLQELKVTCEGIPQNSDEDRKLSRRTLEQIGQSLKAQHSPFALESDIFVGMKNVYVSHKDISKVLDKILFNGKYLLGVAADEDLSRISWNSQGHLTRKVLIQKSDLLFASNPNTIRWGLGKLGYDNPADFENEFKSLKPCIHGSDAHGYDNLFCPREQRNCWIKADPTFEGLKQIICEPKERVRIQETSPEDDFKKIYFNNIKAGGVIITGEKVEFAPTDIDLNKNLVAIIGGRGTGKSLLLDSLLKSFKTSKDINGDRFSKISPDFFETVFCKADGTSIKTSLMAPQGLSYLHVRQGEIKDIAESPYELGNRIKSLLEINYADGNDEDLDCIDVINKINELRQWFQQKDKNDCYCNTEDYCINAISYYTNLITNITSKDTQDTVESYKNNQQIANQDINYIGLIDNKINEILKFQESFNSFINSLNIYMPSDFEPLLNTWNFSIIISQLNEYKSKLENRNKSLLKENEVIKNKLIESGINQDISTLLEKVSELQKNLSWFENHKRIIAERRNELELLVGSRNSLTDVVKKNLQNEKVQIDQAYANLKNGKDGWTEAQKSLVNNILIDIEISAEIIFDENKFYNGIWDILNGTKFRASARGTGLDKMKQMIGVHSLEDFYSLCSGVSICINNDDEKVTIDDIQSQSDLFISNAIYSLYEYIYLKQYYREYLKVVPRLTYKGKPPEKLSIGQRGTFYLCLRLATDPFGSPFVFDQPEDDLDNEFITNTLVPIFTEIKKYRQVIIATHNANLVVNADAEQVIVAHNNEEIITFTSGSLENKDIKENVCRILEGGKDAFMSRENKYGFKIRQK